LNDKMVKHLHDQIAKWQNPFTGETGVFLNLFQSDTNMFVIRKDWLERDGIEIPRSIPELVDIAKKYNQPPETYGWTGSTYRGIETPMVYEMILYSIGGAEFDENNKPLYDSPLGIQAAEYYVELANTTTPGGKAVNWFEATNLFMQNNVAITTPHGSGNMIINDPSQSEVPVGAAVILTEGFVPMVGGWHYGIAKDQPQEKKELAFLYTLWLTTREIERERGKLMPALTCPINYDAYSDPERIEGSGATGEVDLAARRDILLRANNRGYARYPFSKQVEIILAAELSSAAAGGQTPEESMKNIQKQVEELIEEAGL
jgi:multiple sugar transport system substrate-binding protein